MTSPTLTLQTSLCDLVLFILGSDASRQNLQTTSALSKVDIFTGERYLNIDAFYRFVQLSQVELAKKGGEPRKNSKEANFGINGKHIFHIVTYPKFSQIHFREKILYSFKLYEVVQLN